MTQPLVRVLIVDHNDLSRQNLCVQLSEYGYVVGEARDEWECRQQINWHPDLIIIDVDIPVRYGTQLKDGLGIEIARLFRDKSPAVGILFFCVNESFLSAAEDLYRSGSGGIGYVSKNTCLNVTSVMSPVVAGNWLSVLTKPNKAIRMTEEAFLSGLADTPRQIVLYAVDQLDQLTDEEMRTAKRLGENNRAIADALQIALNTVETRLTSIYSKLGVNTVDRRLRAVLLDRALSIHTLLRQQ